MPKFHSYDKSLLNELRRNYDVDYFIYDSEVEFCLKNQFFYRLIRKLNTVLLRDDYQYLLESIYYREFNNKILNVSSNEKYDYLLVIKGFGISINTLNNIKARKKIIYQWDSIKRFPTVKNKYKCFDKIFTFDSVDSKNGFGEYLPNFIEPINISMLNSNKKSIFFVGEYNEFRYEILKTIRNKCNDCGIETDFTLITNNIEISDKDDLISNFKVDNDIYKKRFLASSIILEISREGQNGYTQRYYEAIQAKKIVIGNRNAMYSIDEFLNMDSREILYLKPKISDEDESMTNILKINNWIKKIIHN